MRCWTRDCGFAAFFLLSPVAVAVAVAAFWRAAGL